MYLSVEQYINDPVKPYWDKITVYDARKRCNVIGEISRDLPIGDHAKAYRGAVAILQKAVHTKWREDWRVVADAAWKTDIGAATFINTCESNRLARLNSPHYRSAQP